MEKKQEDQESKKTFPGIPDWCPMHYHGQRKNALLPTRPRYPGIGDLPPLMDQLKAEAEPRRRAGVCLLLCTEWNGSSFPCAYRVQRGFLGASKQFLQLVDGRASWIGPWRRKAEGSICQLHPQKNLIVSLPGFTGETQVCLEVGCNIWRMTSLVSWMVFPQKSQPSPKPLCLRKKTYLEIESLQDVMKER